MLDWFWLHGGGSGEVGSLKVGSREVCHGRSDDRGEISDGFLDLGRVVVCFELINPCGPVGGRIGRVVRGYRGNKGLPEDADVGRTKGIDSSLELFVLCRNRQ